MGEGVEVLHFLLCPICSNLSYIWSLYVVHVLKFWQAFAGFSVESN